MLAAGLDDGRVAGSKAFARLLFLRLPIVEAACEVSAATQ